MACRVAHVEQGQQTCRMPGRAAGQLIALQQHDIIPAGAGQMISDRGADGATTDDKGFDMRFHGLLILRNWALTSAPYLPE